MKILADTNVLISALFYPNSQLAATLRNAASKHTLVLTDYNIAELHKVTKLKFPDKLLDLDALLAKFPFELVTAPLSAQKLIADPKDAPILNAAIINEVDVLISGDKHFLQLNIERPQIMTVSEYAKKYV